VATIYLPDRRRPMLPTVLSDSLCSLLENEPRFAFAMEITVETATGRILSLEEPVFKNVIISVAKNYHYDDPELLYVNESYKELFEITKKMTKHIVKTSHDVVSFWMVKMNHLIGQYMVKNQIGIFRSTVYLNELSQKKIDSISDIDISHLNDDTRRVIQSWNNNMGKYVLFEEDVDLTHCMMDANYIHITSPIRRLVDLLNQIILFNHSHIVKKCSDDSIQFLNNWKKQIEYINTSMRSIRKVQTDCDLLHKCTVDPDIMKTVHDGIIFDMISKNDKSVTFMVYLEDLKLLSRVVLLPGANIENYVKAKFRLYLFEDEDKTKRKIRLQMV
jgi:exoribonuclease R